MMSDPISRPRWARLLLILLTLPSLVAGCAHPFYRQWTDKAVTPVTADETEPFEWLAGSASTEVPGLICGARADRPLSMPELQDHPLNIPSRHGSRLGRGVHSALAALAFPLGGWWLGGLHSLATPERMEHGLAIVLPGVEGGGPLNWCIARGLADGGWPGAVVVHDWTTGLWPLFLYHLRANDRNRRRADEVAALIVRYQDEHPGRPVFLVGHSGGGAMAVWALEALPEGRSIRGAVLLGPALSPAYPLGPALCRVEEAVWNFWSPLDLLFLAAGTSVFGTVDGRHTVSAGWGGFRLPGEASERELYDARLRQHGYRPAWLSQFHPGTHFGWTNRVFVAESLVPLLREASERVNEAREETPRGPWTRKSWP
jgi:pimeloyl-ACP methyl ester carboxylesterase